tara:strand:- start:16573 stop:17475 length:903 start_codon:yes stop_codon:yes gene_type:complete
MAGHVNPAAAATQEIVAVVNDAVISDSDLNKRMRLIMVSSGLPNTSEIRQKLTQQVLGGLINEQLMLQEAKKFNIEINQADIDAGFAQIAQQNQVQPEQFMAMLKRSGIDVSTMIQQVTAQVAWGKVVQSRLRPRINISERDIDDALERIQSKIGTTEYLAAEIFLPVEDPKQDGQTRKLANNLVYEIKSGKASFFKLAQQFSQAAGSMNGGDKGWVNEAQLSEELLKPLESAQKNQITAPVKTLDGYHILFLRDKRALSEETVPSRQQVEYSIGNERLDKLQRRHLMDLRLASFVDIRV